MVTQSYDNFIMPLFITLHTYTHTGHMNVNMNLLLKVSTAAAVVVEAAEFQSDSLIVFV